MGAERMELSQWKIRFFELRGAIPAPQLKDMAKSETSIIKKEI
jgi:hypothetical protein